MEKKKKKTTADKPKTKRKRSTSNLCTRCGKEPKLLGGKFCSYCQQIWDHLD